METFREIFPLLVALGVVGLLWFFSRRAQNRALAAPTPADDYEVVITEDSLSCRHIRRPTETVRWDEVTEILLVPTSDGPLLPDLWLIFVGRSKGCSLPFGARGFEGLWPVLEARFPGLDLPGQTDGQDAPEEKVVWKK